MPGISIYHAIDEAEQDLSSLTIAYVTSERPKGSVRVGPQHHSYPIFDLESLRINIPPERRGEASLQLTPEEKKRVLEVEARTVSAVYFKFRAEADGIAADGRQERVCKKICGDPARTYIAIYEAHNIQVDEEIMRKYAARYVAFAEETIAASREKSAAEMPRIYR